MKACLGIKKMEKFMSYSSPAEILGVVYIIKNEKTKEIYYEGCLADVPSIIHLNVGKDNPDDIIQYCTIFVKVVGDKKGSKNFGKEVIIELLPLDSEILKKAIDLTHKKVQICFGRFIDDDKKPYITSIEEIN